MVEKMLKRYGWLSLIAVMLTLAGCRNDDVVLYPDDTPTPDGYQNTSAYKGMYVLCEGNMGANKASLDYLDMTTGTYSRNIYPSRNPGKVLELGDVGNDIKVYGTRLWMVINQSNRVEVASAATAVSLGSVNIPNARYLAFHDRYAYVSSYVGPVSGQSVLGEVYRIDTLTQRVDGRCTVGFQPEEMAVMGGKLYVANSGGYRALQGEGYDRRVSVIDLNSFSVERTIDVAPNLFRLRRDRYDCLWATSRGDYDQQPGRIYKIEQGIVADSIDVAATDLAFHGDSLLFLHRDGCGLYDLRNRRLVSRQLLRLPSGEHIETPYGLMVDDSDGRIYVMDATNYVSSGKLFCFDDHGNWLWTCPTSDIPGHACWVKEGPDGLPDSPSSGERSPYIAAVDAYCPAPGQFVNVLPKADADDNADSLCAKCTAALRGGMDGLVTLGGFGGYIIFHFDHPVRNVHGQKDLLIRGNYIAGAAEPGIVMVSVDVNGNGLPDDPWYELSGSADTDSIGKEVYGYEITYQPAPMADIPWVDNLGRKGVVARNSYHTQEYFPLWMHQSLTFRGTLLPPNGHNRGTNGAQNWLLDSFRQGYVDNLGDDEGCSFDLDWAVDAARKPVSLDHIDFVKVYTAENQQCGWLGETSTEIRGARDLHP